MANKIISINKQESSKSATSTYIDVDMIAKPINSVSDTEEYNRYTNKKSKKQIVQSVDLNAIFNSINNIFKWIPGERILDPEFGSRLKEYLYEGITKYNEERIFAEIKNCLNRWEPRVDLQKVTNVSTVENTEDNTIVLDIEFSVKGLRNRIFRKSLSYNVSDSVL